MGKEKKLLIIIVTVLLISNTGTKNVVGLVQCFQAEERRKHISLERELINVGLTRKGAFLSQMRKNINIYQEHKMRRKEKILTFLENILNDHEISSTEREIFEDCFTKINHN
jgi:hypothetical protein